MSTNNNINKIGEIVEIKVQLVELQSQLAFQEDTIQSLNDVVTRQQQQIDNLNELYQNHKSQLEQINGEMDKSVVDEKPPHY